MRGVLVAAGTERLLAALVRADDAGVAGCGVGRVLPTRLFRRAPATPRRPWRSALDDGRRHYGLESLDLQVVDRIAGPNGLDVPGISPGESDCPIAPELLRPI